MIKNAILPLLFLLAGNAAGQTMSSTPDDLRENYQRGPLGLKMGLGLNYWAGSEIPNARLATGMHAGIIYAAKESKKHKIGFQTELSLGHNQYRFDNADLGTRSITRISLNQLSAPLLLTYPLSNPTDDRYKAFIFGLAPSFTISSSAQVSNQFVPIQKDNYLQRWDNLPLNALSMSAAIGYQMRGPIAGYQIQIKNSLNNLNNNFIITDAVPVTGKGNPIRFFNIEFSLLF